MQGFNRFAAAAALTVLAAPALADTKAGVDAWGRGDYAKAVEEWRGPALQGDADAQFNLGQAYKLGRGVPADFLQAEQWYGKAAAQGHVQAADNYGLALFQNGKREAARPWLEKSAARGEPRAQYVLGTMLFNGDAVQKDWVRAYALMTRAAASGLPQATKTLQQMDGFIPMQQRQQGTVLARHIEAQSGPTQTAAQVSDTTGGGSGMRGVELPPSTAGAPTPVYAPPPAPPARPAPRPAPVVAKAPPPAATPVRAAPQGKGWRVQFGAFANVGNAKGLFDTLKRKVGAVAALQPYLVTAGSLTKLQAGPLASRAEALQTCAAVKPTGTPCVPVAP